jgi:hypothetical protein
MLPRAPHIYLILVIKKIAASYLVIVNIARSWSAEQREIKKWGNITNKISSKRRKHKILIIGDSHGRNCI